MNTLDYLRGQFESQKEFLNHRFAEVRDDFQEMKGVNEKQDKRLDCLEKRKWRDRSYAAGGGVIGGFLAYFATKLRMFFNGV